MNSYKKLFTFLWHGVRLFLKDRQLFGKMVDRMSSFLVMTEYPLIQDKYLTEEFLNGKPYSHEKLFEVAVTDKGTYRVEDDRQRNGR